MRWKVDRDHPEEANVTRIEILLCERVASTVDGEHETVRVTAIHSVSLAGRGFDRPSSRQQPPQPRRTELRPSVRAPRSPLSNVNIDVVLAGIQVTQDPPRSMMKWKSIASIPTKQVPAESRPVMVLQSRHLVGTTTCSVMIKWSGAPWKRIHGESAEQSWEGSTTAWALEEAAHP